MRQLILHIGPGKSGSSALQSWLALNQEQLAGQGVNAGVIDVATLKPLDMATILSAVERSGHAIIVHEAAMTAGYGAEIAARIAAEGLFNLSAPVERVTGYDTVMPLAQLEHHYLPGVERIEAAVKRVLASD